MKFPNIKAFLSELFICLWRKRPGGGGGRKSESRTKNLVFPFPPLPSPEAAAAAAATVSGIGGGIETTLLRLLQDSTTKIKKKLFLKNWKKLN